MSQFQSYHVRDVPNYSKMLYYAAWSCAGDYLGVIAADKNIYISQLTISSSSGLPSLKTVHSIPTNVVMVKIAWHPTINGRLVMCGDDKSVEVWDVKSSKPALKLTTLGGNLNVNWSRDGRYIVVGNKSEYFLVFDAASGAQLRKKKFTHEMNEMVWSFNSDFILAATGADGMGAIDVINSGLTNNPAETTSTLATQDLTLADSLTAHSAPCQLLCVSPDYLLLALGGSDKSVSLWNLRDLTPQRFLSIDPLHELRTLSFSACSRYLCALSCSDDAKESTLLFVDCRTGEPVGRVDLKVRCSVAAWQSGSTASGSQIVAVVCEEKPQIASQPVVYLKLISFLNP